ncbi:MAG: DUF502 domain-containing protein [Chitinophagaceae bacterium]
MKTKLKNLHIVQHFFQGILVVAPVFFTFYVLQLIFDKLDSLIQVKFPRLGIIPGVGVLIILVGVTLIGYLSSVFFLGRLFDLFERLLEKIPVIKFLYSSLKEVFDSLIGQKKKFDRPILAHIYSDEVWELGFITQDDVSDFGLKNMVAVYVPMSLAISGKVYFVQSSKITTLNNISAASAMKFAVSGGVASIGAPEHQPDISSIKRARRIKRMRK